MHVQPEPPAPSTPAVLPAPAPAQIATAKTASAPPAVPAHTAQATPPVLHQPARAGQVAPPTQFSQTAPPAKNTAPASPAPGVTATQTAPPTAPATTPTVFDPAQDVAGDVTVDDNAPTPASIDSEAEERLTIEIVILWGDCKSANATARLMRAEGKPLRLALAEERKSLRWALAEKLYVMKAILVGTGREGRWAPYLSEQGLPVASADRLVGEHQAKLAAPKDKLLSEELPVATVDDVRKLAKKMLPKLCRVLTTAELAFEFIGELFWNLDAAEGRETDDGVEVFRTSHEDDASDEDQAAESAGPAPTVS